RGVPACVESTGGGVRLWRRLHALGAFRGIHGNDGCRRSFGGSTLSKYFPVSPQAMRNAVNPIGRLHVLTDFHLQQRFSHAEIARLAIAGGADTIQFRQKAGAIRHRLHEAEQTADVCRAAGCTLLIDDDVALALATAAAGVHVGQADLPVAVVRRILGPQAIVGATATYAWQAVEAWKQGADYIGFGPVFPTRSKANPASVKG